MKEDYLWDKSGEPDPEIERLERVLGGLRGRRGAQDLMHAFDSLQPKRTRPLTKWLAVAAALAFALLALGVFSALQRQSVKQASGNSQLVMVNPGTPALPVEGAAQANGPTVTKQALSEQPVEAAAPTATRMPLESRRRSVNRRREAFISKQERMEGLMAKEQLLKALEITSSELDFVQKKVKGDEKTGPSS